MSEWKPIETAPKDGTPIDLFITRRWTDYVWDAEVEGWTFAQDINNDWQDRRTWPASFPTHWMPIPLPPQGAKAPRA